MNVPNTLTMLRVVFAIAVFYFCAQGQWDLCLLFFSIASLTDFVDGWWARRFRQITVFGRIMDPFADKFLVCGVFVCLVAIPAMREGPGNFPDMLMLQPWMVIVILARELLITSLRAVVEKSGGDFSAKWVGKWKMGLQCVAVIACFLYLEEATHLSMEATGALINPPFSRGIYGFFESCLGNDFVFRHGVFYTMILTLWGTVILTLYSGVSYSINAARMIRRQNEQE